MSDSSKDTEEAAIINSLCDIIQGSTLLKAGRSVSRLCVKHCMLLLCTQGRPHFRHFKLSSDLTRLNWESAKKIDAAVLISQITEMKLGQVTPVFIKNPIPQCEVSFIIWQLYVS